MNPQGILDDERKLAAIVDYFWWVCSAGDGERQLWIDNDNPRVDLIEDAAVRGLRWLSEFLRAWLLRSHGVLACQNSYEVCMAVFEYAKANRNNGAARYQRIYFWLDDTYTAELGDTEPILSREDFESIRQATTAERHDMYDQFINWIRTQRGAPT
ncbi:hypothetical protein [Nocardia colli]|uniref:hypothetical protein n=1 Tax=Nocardia colli TaxID=2545717 RepID=UPI0035D548E6